MSKKNTSKKSLSPAQRQEVSRLVKRAVNASSELKYLQTGSTPTASLTGTFVSVTDVPAGTTDLTRIGDTIEPVSLQLKLQIEVPFASTAGHFLRVFVFQWKVESSVEAPSHTALFINDATAGARNFRSYYSVDRLDSFRFLWDKMYDTASVYNEDTSNLWVDVNISLAQVKKRIQFEAATTDGWGKIYVGFQWSTLTNALNVNMQAMFRFRDT